MITAELPNRRVEAWKYSDLRAAVGDALPPIAPTPNSAPAAAALSKALKAIEVVFENGRLAYWPSEGVRKAPRVWAKEDPDKPRHGGSSVMGRFAAELTADDWMPIIEAGDCTRPVCLRFIGSAPATSHMRVGVIVPEGRSLDLIESYEGQSPGLSNTLVEAFVSHAGFLRRVVMQSVTGSDVQVATAQINLTNSSRYQQFILSEGCKLARIETHVHADGEGAEVELNGVYMVGAGRHADLTSVITHAVPGGVTRQLIKGVARKGGRGVFQGKIEVAQGAQRTDARQYHHGMLLEDGAEIFAKPELMIHADDVQCAHGNTAGGLDETALFYMRSRGIPEAAARALLIEAFLAEAIPAGLPDALNDELLTRIRTWLGSAS